MNFEKKLVILTGKTGRGTALLERNGMGTFITLNVFALPDLTSGEYALGVKTNTHVFRRELGSLGKIKSRFALTDGDYGKVHLVIFRTFDEEVVLYGTGEVRKMWEGNLMDGLRRNGLDKKTADSKEVKAPTQDFSYSERKIEDYFLDIDTSGQYADGALAQVNYFDYSQRPVTENESGYYDKPDSPSIMQRNYLNKRFGIVRSHNASVMHDSVLPDEQVAAALSAEPSSGEDLFGAVKSMGNAAPQEENKGKEEPAKKIKSASEYTVEQAISAVKTGAGFYDRVKEQLEDLFARGEKFEALEKAMPGTKWVKVDYDDSGRYYVVGLIGAAPDYIAYGVPGKYGSVPAGFESADFVPIYADKPTGDGFWVLFQSASTGEEIEKQV